VVIGQAIFQEWFRDFEDQYVLIGGTAASITMAEAGQPFRGTKDLDIVLHVEALTPAFGQRFWQFVQAGAYQQKEGDPDQRPCLYRFQKPLDDEFPHMLELFSRVPDGLRFVPPGHLTPIPIDEQVSSLSAILLDEDYYQFVLSGRKNKYGLPSWVGEDRLIPLKAVAWMEMSERAQSGEPIDSKKINKHLSDIVLLSSLLQPGQVIELPEKIRANLEVFVRAVAALNRAEQMQSMRRIAEAYALRL
jgi:hypothetical protein